MIYGSVCSGIEAASVAWEPLGWQPAWFAEIEAFPSAVLAHHWPAVVNWGDMTRIKDLVAAGLCVAPDILVGGTPCQAFSVAGLRNSLDDERGQLSLEYVKLLNQMDETRIENGQPESICVWENVPGVLNTKDNAFGCFLAAIAGEEDPLQPAGERWTNAGVVYGPQRKIAWRVLDAQYFGLAQRRRRVFVVASARAGFDPSAVLFEREGVQRHTAPSRETRQDPTSDVAKCLGAQSQLSHREDRDNLIVGTLDTECGYEKQTSQSVKAGHVIAIHDKATRHKGGSDQTTYCLQGSMVGRKDKNGPAGGGINEDLCYTLNTGDKHAVCCAEVAPTIPSSGAPYERTGNERVECDAIVACVHGTQDPCVSADKAFALGRNTGQENVVAYGSQGYSKYKEADCATTLRACGSKQTDVDLVSIRSMHVRRLTTVECARLQGFPDNHTNIPYGRPRYEDQICPDGHQYKAYGNSMAVAVMAWIGNRIAHIVGD